jgi:ankyrin repeat protein
MNYETFEIKLFENLKNKNSKCLKEIENNKEIIKSNLGENGEPEILEGFITKLSSVILQANSKKIFSLIEDVLLHPCFSRVLGRFRESDILIKACQKANKYALKWLLTMNINLVTQDNENGMTALMYAVSDSSLFFVVQELLRNPYQSFLNIEDKNGETALFHALKNKEALNILVTNPNIEINHINKKGETALLYCCKYDIFESIQTLLVNKNINVNMHDEDLQTPAMILTRKNRDNELRKLNMRNCNYDYINKKGESALSIILKKIYSEKYDNFNFLLRDQVNILTSFVHLNCNFSIPVDEDENTAIMVFLLAKDYYTLGYVMRYHKGIDLSVKNKYGESASSLCLKSEGFVGIRQFLKYPSFDLEYIDNNGNTMLMLCAMNNMQQMIERVIENNVNIINNVNNRNENALIIATKLDCSKAIATLIEYPIFVNQQDCLGNTALHYAVDIENTFIIKLLIKTKADINIKNNDGFTPIDIAKEKKNDDLVNCLTNSSSSQSSSSSSSSVKNKNENENIMQFKGNPNLEYKETIKNLLPYMGNRYSEHPLDPKTMKRLKHIYEEKIGKLNESTNNNEYRFGPRDSRQAVLQLSVALTLIL